MIALPIIGHFTNNKPITNQTPPKENSSIVEAQQPKTNSDETNKKHYQDELKDYLLNITKKEDAYGLVNSKAQAYMKGNDRVAAYTAVKEARDFSDQLNTDFVNLNPPSDLPSNIKSLLKDGTYQLALA